MKKLFFYPILMLVAAVTLTSCDDDNEIANTLEGTWRGNMYISSYYDGYYYDATATEVTFLRDPYTFSSGTGYWVDYYSGAPWDYVACHIDWTVDFGTIKVYFREEGTTLYISDYRLSHNRFYGTIYDGGNDVDFELYHVSSPNYNYSYWGYDDWYDNWNYWRTRSGVEGDSTSAAAPSKPVRVVRQR